MPSTLSASTHLSQTMRPTTIPHPLKLIQPLVRPRPRLFTTSPHPHPSPLITVRDIPAAHTGHIRILGLNNPISRNAISRQLLTDLRHEIFRVKKQVEDEAARGEVVGEGTRVLILASEIDEAFCAGADLKERKGMGREETNEFLTSLRSTFHTLSNFPVPIISAVASVALGGGFELALSTDLRVFASSASVGLPETRLGIIPGAGGTYRLAKLIGTSKALNLILRGTRISGGSAAYLGICERLVGDNREKLHKIEELRKMRLDVMTCAIQMAEEICKGAPGATQAAFRAVKEGTEEAEVREYEGVLGMGDRDEALRAFGEKREAVFRGR